MPKTVLSYFATGSQGGSMAKTFVNSDFNTRTITRNPSSDAAKGLADAGVELFQGDLANRDALAKANEGVDIVALIVPFFHPQSEMYMQNAVDAAKDAGVELVVFNASSPLPTSPVGDPSVDHRLALQTILETSGLPYITFALGSYMENLLGPWTAQPIRDENILSYPIPDGSGFSWIATKDIGAMMVEAAKRPELANTIFRVSGPENLTGSEMAASFSRGLDREIQWQYITPRELGDRCAAVIGKPAGDGLAQYYETVQKHPAQVVPFYDMSPVLEKLPVTLTTLEDWVREHAFLFQPS